MRTERLLSMCKTFWFRSYRSYRILLRILTIKPFAKKQKWQLRLIEVSLMILLWWKLDHEVPLEQRLWHQSQTIGPRNFRDIA